MKSGWSGSIWAAEVCENGVVSSQKNTEKEGAEGIDLIYEGIETESCFGVLLPALFCEGIDLI